MGRRTNRGAKRVKINGVFWGKRTESKKQWQRNNLSNALLQGENGQEGVKTFHPVASCQVYSAQNPQENETILSQRLISGRENTKKHSS